MTTISAMRSGRSPAWARRSTAAEEHAGDAGERGREAHRTGRACALAPPSSAPRRGPAPPRGSRTPPGACQEQAEPAHQHDRRRRHQQRRGTSVYAVVHSICRPQAAARSCCSGPKILQGDVGEDDRHGERRDEGDHLEVDLVPPAHQRLHGNQLGEGAEQERRRRTQTRATMASAPHRGGPPPRSADHDHRALRHVEDPQASRRSASCRSRPGRRWTEDEVV